MGQSFPYLVYYNLRRKNMASCPEFFEIKLISQYGEELKDQIIKGFTTQRKSSFRVNTIKATTNEIEERLNFLNVLFQKSSWSDTAFIIENKDEEIVKNDEIYIDGKIYFQSLSSMLPPIILNPLENKDILDMAAAPGGKTTQIAAITNNKAHITACEMNNVRIEKLKYNIEKQGATSVYIMKKDARQIDDFFSFDQILLDAPCSGSGTLNLNDTNFSKYFTEKLIEKSAKTQEALLEKAIKVLKKGEEMVYSTCSILYTENEQIVEKALKKFNIEIVPIEFKGIDDIPKLPVKVSGTLCVMPNEFYEGFYVAKIRKIK